MHRLRIGPGRSFSIEKTWTERDGLSSHIIQNLFRSTDGKLWGLTEHGLTGWDENAPEPRFVRYADTQGLIQHGLYGMAQDSQGALWVRTETNGVVRLLRNGIRRFGKSDGLQSLLIRDVFEDQDHHLLVVRRIDTPDRAITRRYRGPILHLLQGDRFSPFVPSYPENLDRPGWGERQIVLQDHTRQWWIATEQGLFRYPGAKLTQLPNTKPSFLYSKGRGLPSNDVFRLAEDTGGNIWIGTMGGGITRWHRKTQQFSHMCRGNSASQLATDSSGNLWMGWWFDPGLGRYRNGELKIFNQDSPVPGVVSDILFDDRGRLWITSTSGLSFIEHPGDTVWRLQSYTAAQGITGNHLFCLTEGRNGRLYIGSDHGLDELDPATGRVRHYGMQDGLPTEAILSAHCDKNGVLWFGTHYGLVRFQPANQPVRDWVPLRLTGLRVAGRPWPISKLGEVEVSNIKVKPDANLFQVTFADLAFGSAGPLRFQYELGGSGLSWSSPSADRVVNFAGLAPGTYRLQIRAVGSNGSVRSAPVVLNLRVMPAFWQTWWFQCAVFASAVFLIILIYRYRIAKLLAVHRVRARIANDLHDDVGSGLSQIAIWSDIALRNNSVGVQGTEALHRIAASSRALVDSIGDIVWTVNPRRDSVGELLQRIRYYASEACSAREIALQFDTADRASGRRADSGVRHDIYLIAKEAIHNAVKHSGCTQIRIEIVISRAWLDMRITDKRERTGARH